jgi:hypothetical protein
LIYGAENWKLTERYKKRIEAVEMDAFRRSMRISRMDKIRNEEVRLGMGIEGTIINDIERKQLTWYGHVQRMEEKVLPWKVLQWIPQGHKKEKTKRNWMDGRE